MTQGRQEEEMKDITLLGNQNNNYQFDYRPDVLETFVNKHQGETISLNLTVQNLRHSALSQVNPTLLQSISHISRMLKWLSLSH